MPNQRMSCSDPNLQQIPRESDYRRCFTARPGCVLLKADYSQVELRIAAKVANEPVMIAAYQGQRRPPHPHRGPHPRQARGRREED